MCKGDYRAYFREIIGQMKRFQIHDDLGIIRAFDTKSDALNWLKERPEFHLVTLPKEKIEPMNFDDLGDCLL